MRHVVCLVLLILLVMTDAQNSTHLPCYWKTACHVTCKQVAWNSAIFRKRGQKKILGEYCEKTLEYAKKSFSKRGLRQDFCKYLLDFLENAKMLQSFAVGLQNEKEDSGEKYFASAYINEMLHLCTDHVCSRECARA
ncbi:hypothetical protein RB195_005545 [Necator americanus]|uniref:Uncharacterized protein n=2 Tax=Necator americanus TaxID=51031 RepID=W2TPH0_NECAM|nr:hypothetical protein NECAME_07135 [Necator americanus]ETN83980.1 hypothetical protein NECAME_07135 [Necator americanus]